MTRFLRPNGRTYAALLPRIAVSVTVLTLTTDVAAAQTMSDSGRRFRVTQSSGTQVAGVLQHVSTQELTVWDPSRRVVHVIPRTDIRLVERSLGLHRAFWRNFWLTMVITSVGSGLISAAEWEYTGSGFMVPETRGDAFGFGFAIGVMVGLPAGLVVGAMSESERWLPVASTAIGGSNARLSAFVGGGSARAARVGLQLPVVLGRAP